MILEDKKVGETFEHQRIKEFIFENFPNNNNTRTVQYEKGVGDQRIDVYLEIFFKKKIYRIAVEIQHSKISERDVAERTRNYNNKGYFVLWILNGSGSYDRQPRISEGIIITKGEKALHTMYRNRVYYLNATHLGIESPLYSLHFSPFYIEKSTRYGLSYYKRSSRKRSLIPAHVPSYTLVPFQSQGYKLVRFYDNEVRSSCISEVVRYITNCRLYTAQKHNDIAKKLRSGIPLGLILTKFSEKYGLHLLFDVLKYKKYLTKHDAKYVFNKLLWFDKMLNPYV